MTVPGWKKKTYSTRICSSDNMFPTNIKLHISGPAAAGNEKVLYYTYILNRIQMLFYFAQTYLFRYFNSSSTSSIYACIWSYARMPKVE